MAKTKKSSTQENPLKPENELTGDLPEEAAQVTIRADFQKLQGWLKTNSLEVLRGICLSATELGQQAKPDEATKVCSRILNRLLPTGVDQFVVNLVTPSAGFLQYLDEIAPRELARELRSIAFECAPRVVAKSQKGLDRWESLETLLCVDEDGEQDFLLTFTRRDAQSLTLRGSLDAAVGEVLPRLMRTLARADIKGLDENAKKAFGDASASLKKSLGISRPGRKSKAKDEG